MALLDISLVTRSLLNLIEEHVTASQVWPPAVTLRVSPEPPDGLSGDHTLGLYLYHISEDADYKNLPPPGRDVPPIRYTPMGLILHYQLTAHSDLDDDVGTYREQLMMGCALKALRDYPVIDDTTTIGGVNILTALIRGGDNRFRIMLQPVTPDQAVEYWTAGSSPLRLAAYYEVSVALLEPETMSARAGRVLSYGVYTFTRNTPRLDSSFNLLSFTIPGETDPREVELRPAQVPFDGAFTFVGSSLTGDTTTLLLQHPRWPDLVEADLTWGVQATSNRVSAVVQATASGEDILPGTYAALVRVTTQRSVPGGGTRTFEHLSNACPFAITPRIDSITTPTPLGVVTVEGFIFQHAQLDPDDVHVYIGENRLDVGTAGSLNPGEFAVVDATHLEARLPAGLTPGAQAPFRLFINGVESPPNWIQVP